MPLLAPVTSASSPFKRMLIVCSFDDKYERRAEGHEEGELSLGPTCAVSQSCREGELFDEAVVEVGAFGELDVFDLVDQGGAGVAFLD